MDSDGAYSDDPVDEEYFTANESWSDSDTNDCEPQPNVADQFYIYTARDGTHWYLPKYYRPDVDIMRPSTMR